MVSAPIEIVWSLLTDPSRRGDFFDVRIIRVAVLWGVRSALFAHRTEIRVHRSQRSTNKLGLNVQLPFGITVREDLDCIPLSNTRCRVNYHCNFGFAKGWRGAITRTIMRRKLDAGPVDSLSRLKRAAEQRYTK